MKNIFTMQFNLAAIAFAGLLILAAVFFLSSCTTDGAGVQNGFLGVGGGKVHTVKGPHR